MIIFLSRIASEFFKKAGEAVHIHKMSDWTGEMPSYQFFIFNVRFSEELASGIYYISIRVEGVGRYRP